MRPARFGPALLTLTLLVSSAPTAAQPSSTDFQTPPPVSGRRPSAPETIIPADVLSRVELLRAEVSLLRTYMGRIVQPQPYLQVEGAQPREVYFQAANLYARAGALLFQEVRTSGAYAARAGADRIRAVDVFHYVDHALALVLQVKAAFGIENTVGESPSPDTPTASDVFNAIVHANAEMDLLLDRSASASDAYRQVTQAVHYAAALHAALTSSGLPPEPEFEPNKAPADVEARFIASYELVRQVATLRGIEMLSLAVDEADDVSTPAAPGRGGPSVGRSRRGASGGELLAIILAELAYMHSTLTDGSDVIRATHPGRRVPSHVYQRAGLLERILTDLSR